MTVKEAIEILSRPKSMRGAPAEILTAHAMAIEALEKEPRKGHWIEVTNGRGGYECNICHEYAPSYRNGDDHLTKYCPNCGCRMVEPQESEVKE